MKERAAEGDDLAKLVQERFGETPDALLLRFLRARKFDISRSHELMKGSFPESNRLCSASSFRPEAIRHKRAAVRPELVAVLWFFLMFNVTVIEGRASFVLLVLQPITETGRHVLIKEEAPHKGLLCAQMGQRANFTRDHDAPPWEPKR